MRTPAEFAATYQHMSDGQLLQTDREDGLLPEAKQALHEEIRRRGLKPGDLPRPIEAEPHKTKLQKASEEKLFTSGRGGQWGFGLYGHRYLNQSDRESNILVRTKFFVLASFPLVPRASFRFKYRSTAKRWYGWDDDQARVIGKIPIVWPQVFRVWLTAFLYIAGIVAAVVLYEWFKGPRLHP
ncbi:MAG TPA: hypothetical protein VN612_17640 [Acidobacteriaceae bacterium]|nr:hypothetical protein [Acidobacteriaceae bacterium]